MLIVDSSVWVSFFNGDGSPAALILRDRVENQYVVMGDLIMTEVLQGFNSDKVFCDARNFLCSLPMLSMLEPECALQSAINYRKLRKKGVTVRKTIDVMIGTFCIMESIPLLYSDKDFDPMVEHLGLERFSPYN